MENSNPETALSRDPVYQIKRVVDREVAGIRFDHFLVQCLPELSRARIATSIRSGTFTVDGNSKKNSYKLKPGEVVEGAAEPLRELEVSGEKIDFPILFEDEYLLVLSKPPGLVVHPGSGNQSGTLVNGLVHHCSSIADVGDAVRPGIVHRLDKDTSGVMVAAKQDAIHRKLVDAFRDRMVSKEYITLVHGLLDDEEGRIVAPIGRHAINRQKMAVRDPGGKYAATNWQVLDYADERYSLLRVVIETGRTHQIRVHMNYIGHPVTGDLVYGSGRDNSRFPRQMLHASRLVFNHPYSGRKMVFSAPLWSDFATILSDLDCDLQSLATG